MIKRLAKSLIKRLRKKNALEVSWDVDVRTDPEGNLRVYIVIEVFGIEVVNDSVIIISNGKNKNDAE